MPPAAVASRFMTQRQSLSKHRPQSFSIDFHVCALHFWTACLPVQRLLFWSVGFRQSMHRNVLRIHLSSLHLCSLSVAKSMLCVSPPGVYDEDSQWMIQVNRLQKLIDRLEQKVASFLSTFLFPLLSFLFSSVCLFFNLLLPPLSVLAIWSVHHLLKLTTNHSSQQISTIQQHPPTYEHLHICKVYVDTLHTTHILI